MRVNTVLSADLLERVDAFARARHEDRSTAIRQLVDFALRELGTEDAIAAYRGGRLTLREFANALNVDVWAAHDLLAARGVAVAQGAATETAAALAAVTRTLRARGRRTQRAARRR